MNKFLNWFKRETNETKIMLRSVPSLVVAFFILAIVSMGLLANKSIDLPVSWLALDCGIIISWVLFLLMDIITKHFGPKVCDRLCVIAVVVNLILCLFFFIASVIPGFWGASFLDDGTISSEVNAGLDSTFRSTWYVLMGSAIAFLVSAYFNNFLNWTIGKSFKKNPDGFLAFACRAYVSTILAQIVDNLIFAFIVSHVFFGWTVLQCFTCAIFGAFAELLCEILFSPIGYKISRKWKQQEVGKEYFAYISQNKEK